MHVCVADIVINSCELLVVSHNCVCVCISKDTSIVRMWVMKNFLKIFVFSAMRMPLVNITMKRTGDTTAVTQ